MSDIGGIFSTGDLLLLALIAALPGTVLGLVLGALAGKPRRRGGSAALGALAGTVLAALAWAVYLLWLK